MDLPQVALGGTGVKTTVLGFGCATLFREPDAAERLRLLGAAYEAGVRHFDVAPMYGLGRAERELGRFLRSHRSEVTVATKFGIRPTLAGRYFSYAQRPVRRVLRAQPVLADQVRTRAVAPGRLFYQQGGYSADNAKRSLRQSLRRLGTDYIDLLLLHDPTPGSVRASEICAFLEDARTAGLVRSWGITGAPEVAVEVARAFRHVPVWQLSNGIFASVLPSIPDDSALITYGVIGAPLARIVRYLRTNETARERWHNTLGADCADPQTASALLLGLALLVNQSGVVLFGATRQHHIGVAAAIAETSGRLTEDEDQAEKSMLGSFRLLVQTELLTPDLAARRTS